MIVRHLLPSESDKIKAIRDRDQILWDFYHFWMKWRNWESNPPLVIFTDAGDIIGLMGYSIAKKTKIMNLYYIWVDPGYRGRGYADDLIRRVLISKEVGSIKLKCQEQCAALSYWKRLGFQTISTVPSSGGYEYVMEIDAEELLNNLHPLKTERCAKKVVIIMAGGGAAGKSTTSKAFVFGDPVEYKEKRTITDTRGRVMDEWVKWTLYDDCALVGNHHSGTDSNKGPAVVDSAFQECMQERDITIVDGYASSPLWVDMVNEWQRAHADVEVVVLVVHFDLTPETLLARLAQRRGVTPESIHDEYYHSRAGVGKRGDNMKRYFMERCDCEVVVLTVTDDDTTEYIVDLMDQAIEEILQ